MRLDDMPESGNVEDRRGDGGGFGGGGGGMGGMPIGTGGLGIGGMVVLGLIGWALGIDPFMLINGANVVIGGNQGGYEQPYRRRQQQDTLAAPGRRPTRPEDLSRACSAAPRCSGRTFSARTARPIARRGSSCSRARRARPAAWRRARWGRSIARTIARSISTPAFFRELETRFRGCTGKACDFSKAYVIAHEVGHHVQNLLGILPKVQQAQQAVGQPRRIQPPAGAGRTAGRLLRRRLGQPRRGAKAIPRSWRHRCGVADGVRHRRRHAAAEVAGQVVPDSFTHGSAEQRKRWFSTGFREGTVKACNTFASASRL